MKGTQGTMAFLLVLALLSIGVLECQGESYYVDPVAGSSSANCSLSNPCKTIKEAIAQVQYGGDEIVLAATGKYEGDDNGLFTLSKAINFVAQNDDLPVIDLTGVGYFAKWSPEYLADTAQVASISNIKFEGGVGHDYDPSVFQIMGGSSLTFSGCIFSSNAASNGSAVVVGSHDEDLSMESPTLVSFLNCEFSGNTAEEGAAVKIYEGHQRVVLFYGCSFNSNSATGNGGAILSSENVPFSVFHSTFDSNTAGGEGGAIYAGLGQSDISTPISFTNTEFIGNDATAKGGAVAVIGGLLTLAEECLFQQNTVAADPSGQYGGGLYASGVVISTNTTFRGNACPITGTTPPNFAGGALFLTGTGTSSFFRDTTFDSNSCKDGSDFASAAGTSVIIDSALFEADQFLDSDYMIYTTGGTIRLLDCNFNNSGNFGQIRSIAALDGGLVSLGYNDDIPANLTILTLLLEGGGILQTPTELDIKAIGSKGGTIESTSYLPSVLTAGYLDLTGGVTTISGFSVVVTIDLINNGGLVLSNGLTTFGTSTFLESSYVQSQKGSILFKNSGSMDVNGTTFTCDFANAYNASLKLPSVIGTGILPLSIQGTASFDGNLTVVVQEAGIDVYNTAEVVPLISYSSLYSARFSSVEIKNVSNSELVYGETLLSLEKGAGEGGLTGGAVAGIIIGLTIALGLVTFGVWFVVIRPQNEDLSRAYQVAEGSSSEGGYGAVE